MLAGRRPARDDAARLLGVSAAADEATVRRAFRAWAALAHPDHGGDPRHFQALCDARDALLGPIDPGPEIPLRPRRTWRQVVVMPTGITLACLALGLVAAVASVLIAGSSPLLALPAAVASAAWCVALSRAVLRGADHGHVIVTRSLAWGVATGGQGVLAALVGIPLIEVLPLLAVPFVAVIAAVNPAAGLWRARSVNVR
ncbi:MAG: DnaJ domain [Actinomycetota bacterium]|jgi:hypothetical protein